MLDELPQPFVRNVIITGSAFEVANVLGAGFLERVYERALIRELAPGGVNAKAQVSFPVCYKRAQRGRIDS